MTTRITMDEWLAAIQMPEPTGHTSHEIAEALGYSDVHFRTSIRPKMLEVGVLRRTGFRRGHTGASQGLYELVLHKNARQRLLDVGVAIPSRERRGGGRSISSLVAQLSRQKKKP